MGTVVTETVVLSTIVIACLVIYPQLRRKADLRTLTVSELGLETTIGKKSGKFEWNAISVIEKTPDGIRIQNRNLNFLLVPRRAFDSDDDRARFLAEVTRWHGEAIRANRSPA